MAQIIFLTLSFFCLYLVSVFLSAQGIKNKLEKFILSIGIYLSLIGPFALLLTIFEAYNLYSLSLLPMLSSIGLILYFYFSKGSVSDRFKLEPIRLDRYNLILAIVLLCIAYLYFFFPTEFILGGRDHGVYILLGTHISQTGGLYLNDPIYAKLVPILGDTITLGYPGIYSNFSLGLSKDIGSLTAQFYHLFPVYLAIAYDLFGMEGLLRSNAVFGILSLLFIFAIVRRWIGYRAAIVSVLLCGLNPAQIWNIRTTLSEPLGQFLIVFFLFAVTKTIYRKNTFPIFFTGLLLGINSLNRIDNLIFFPALFFLCLYIMFFADRYIKKAIFLVYGFTIASCFAILYGIFYSAPYFGELWKEGSLLKLIVLAGLSILGAHAVWIASYFQKTRGMIGATAGFIRRKKIWVQSLLYISFFGLVLYGFYLRPLGYPEGWAGVQRTALATKSFPIFLWYVPIVIFLFMIFGYVRLLTRSKRIDSLPFVFIGTVLLLGYLYDPSIAPDHFWVSRRWILFSIPFALILGTIGVFSLRLFAKTLTNLVLVAVFLFSLGYSIWRSELFLFRKMLGGFHREFQRVSENIPAENAIYFTTEESIAGPLKYVYGRKTYLIANTQEFLDRVRGLLDQESGIYLIQSTAYFGSHPDLFFEPIADLKLSGLYPVTTKERYPDRMSRTSAHQTVFRIRKNDEHKEQDLDISYEWKMGEAGFQTHSGEFGEDLEIHATRKEGSLVFGPYLTLPKGEYEITYSGKDLGRAKFQISADNGLTHLTEWQNGDQEESKTVRFSVSDRERKDIEFKVNVPGKSNVIVSKIALRRIQNF